MRSLLLVLLSLLGVVFTEVEENPLSDRFIQKLNEAQNSWRAGRNFDVNTPLSHIESLLGVITGDKPRVPAKVVELVDDLPENFDAREQWPDCKSIIGHIQDQSACTSGWAFGAVGAMSDRICIHSNATLKVYISAVDLIACCGDECGAGPVGGCEGGFVESAWGYWTTNGIVSGGNYGSNEGCKDYVFPSCEHVKSGARPACGPTEPTPECTKKCDNTSTLDYKDDLHFGENFYQVDEKDESIQSEIYKNGPVQAALSIYEDFLNYKSGIYRYTEGRSLGLHAVKILGWGVEDGTPYWLCANSWNEDWGDKGYFKILRGALGINGWVWAGLPKL